MLVAAASGMLNGRKYSFLVLYWTWPESAHSMRSSTQNLNTLVGGSMSSLWCARSK